MTRLLAILVVATLAGSLQGCGSDEAHLPYAWPITPYGEPRRDVFTVRYSEWRNTQDEIRAVIAEECGPVPVVARVTETRFVGTLLHPNQMRVECGVALLPTRLGPGQTQPYLIRLRE